ncbi:MAG: peptide-methionine (S)-S-oxide reductase [Cryomorphaceae bacterium]|jgi:peptide-methionine (S)-S-oxide reductase
MKKLAAVSLIIALLGFSALRASDQVTPNQADSVHQKTAVFAGGCFWCIEADFEKLDGVSKVVSGYTGGAAETANYKTVSYSETGHYEAVQVHYDPSSVKYSELVEYFWRHVDPTNDRGQFCDSGSSYLSAIFYANDEEQSIVEKSLNSLRDNKPFADPIVTFTGPAKPFYLAEDYHQDYYKKNPIRYKYYRNGCGRDKRVKQLWGNQK